MPVNPVFPYAMGMSPKDPYEDACARVAAVLREERESRGLSMTALATRAGLSQQSVSYVERGMRIPNLDTLLRVCDALDVPLPEILARATGPARAGRIK